MNESINAAMYVLDPLQTLTTKIWAKMPSVFAALVLLLIGSFLGRWARYVIERGIRLTKLDDYSERLGMKSILGKLGLSSGPSQIMGALVYWLIFLAFLLSAANVVQLTIVSEFLQQVVLFMPKLIAAILVLGGGLLLGRVASEIVLKAMNANNIQGAAGLSRLTFGILLVFASLMAMQCLGIDTSVLARSIQIIVASIGLGAGLAFGIAFGLAGKDFAASWLHSHLAKKKSSEKPIFRRAA